ncbi:MAG: BCCT family transporter [Cloacibacillus porcorum]|uniref:BCCT family transporter n=1 Tax=Cloacibacillus porcorum TaxID=1197717 RepID=UPI0023F26604|nr:BCCT family transporter [Cloacibacillus porcorum]MCD7877790.1 BCCT family transporter [Cloacibacillus porcorum]
MSEKNNNAAVPKRNMVYIISIAITFALVFWGLVSPQSFGAFAKILNGGLTSYYGWGYMLTMNLFVIFCIAVALSRFGNVRLGPDDSRPEYSNMSWFAMLFSAGMGVGLVFYGAAEPLFHFGSLPFGAEPGSVQAARDAIQISFFHWGLHPWAGYAVIAMPLAYYQFRHNAPGLISSIFIPLVGEEKVSGTFGKTVDILAIFATLAGITTSLGLGTLQLNSGQNAIFGIPKSLVIQIAIIVILAVLYTGSAALGIEKGIKVVADFNLWVCLLLMLALFLVGPTLPIVNSLMTGIGDYLSGLIKESFTLAPYGGKYESFLSGWTLYYWAWWISWAPFVGSFVARISRGRTVKEFVSGVLIVPALGSFTWFAIFGTSALHLELVQKIKVSVAVLKDVSVGIFEMYSHYPLGQIMSVVMLVLIITFFVTSANSGTFVLAMLSTHGDLNPPKSKMLVWGILMAALAVVLLLTGGLQNLQTVSLAAAMPFSLIMVCACASFWKALKKEDKKER